MDGTYTVFLGDVSFGNNGDPSGAVEIIFRLSTLLVPPSNATRLTRVDGEFSASLALDAYRDGGTAFFQYVFDGSDSLGFDAPGMLGR